MTRKQCKESLELYKKFVVRMELVARFLAVAEVSQSKFSFSFVTWKLITIFNYIFTSFSD